MSHPILVVDQVLTTVVGGSGQPLHDYLLSMAFANAAARAARNAETGEARVPAFAAQWANQLGTLGWVITQASNIDIQQGGETSTIADQIKASVAAPAIQDAVSALAVLVGPDDSAASPPTTMFWNASVDGTLFVGTFGQVNAGGDTPTFDLATVTLPLDTLLIEKAGLLLHHKVPLDPTSVGALFRQVVTSSISLSVSHISATLQQSVFAPNRQKLIGMLGDKLTDHYATLPADLLTVS